jgi:hypothetical protein
VNEQEVRELFFERLEHLSTEAGYELRHRDGKIWRDTRYYAEPFEAPAWRAQWVERMED